MQLNIENWPSSKIESRSVRLTGSELAYESHWLGVREPGADPHVVLQETTTITVHPDHLLEYTVTLTAASGPVTFGDTKEGGRPPLDRGSCSSCSDDV